MTKRLVAKVGSYEQNGQTKGRYTNLGVVLSNDNGEYMLMDPTVSLSGVLALQNSMAAQSGGQQRDRVMVSIFTDDNGGQRSGNSGGQQSGGRYGGQQGGGYGDQPGDGQGYDSGSSGYGSGGRPGGSDIDEEIPFAPETRI